MALVEGTNCGFVTVAPTADPGGSIATIDTFSVAARFTSPADATKVTEIGWWCDSSSEESNFEVGIYDNDGSPNNLLAGASRTNAKGTSPGWKKATGLDITITGNTIYWIGVQVDNTSATTSANRTANASYSREFVSSSTLPDPWDGGSAAGYIYAFYAVWELTPNSLSGSCGGTSAASASLDALTQYSLSATVAGVSSASASLAVVSTLGLAGTSDGTSSVSGAISIEASSNADCLVDSNATFHADLIGALCYMTSGDNAGEAKEIATVDADGNIMTFAASFSNSISVNDRYSISPIPFKARLWPLQMKGVSRFQRWIMEATSIKVKNTYGVRTGSGAILPGGYWRVGAYRNSGDTIESEVAYVEVDENPASSAGALNIDGVDIEPYIEQISSGTKFELENVEVLVQETDSREVED